KPIQIRVAAESVYRNERGQWVQPHNYQQERYGNSREGQQTLVISRDHCGITGQLQKRLAKQLMRDDREPFMVVVNPLDHFFYAIDFIWPILPVLERGIRKNKMNHQVSDAATVGKPGANSNQPRDVVGVEPIVHQMIRRRVFSV